MERIERDRPDFKAGEIASGYRLSTGREFEAHLGIIGITADAAEDTGYGSRVYDGFDGTLDDELEAMTPAERLEVADFMIALWQQYRSTAEAGE